MHIKLLLCQAHKNTVLIHVSPIIKKAVNNRKIGDISFLNVLYKLASSLILNRIKLVLNRSVNEDQKGILSGRFIGENTCMRLIYDLLFETKQ